MLALVLSFAMLARFGPWLEGVLVFLMPAPALAVDQSEPKASVVEEEEDLGGALLLKEGVDEREGLAPWVEGAGGGTETEVK